MNENISGDEELRRKADEMLPRLDLLKKWSEARIGPDHRAFVIEFAGMPKAGKSSAISNIRHFLSHGPKVHGGALSSGYRVYTPAEGVSLRTPAYLKKRLLDFNTWAGAYALQELLQARHDNYNDVVLLDRGPWDAGCWLQYVKSSALSEDDDANDVQQMVAFFQMAHWMELSDLHVVMVVDPAEARDRERAQRLIRHEGPAADETLMNAMAEIYRESFERLRDEKTACCAHVGEMSSLLLDATKMDPKAVALNVLDRMFKVLERKLAAKEREYQIDDATIWKMIQPMVTRKGGHPNRVKTYLSTDFTKRASGLPLPARARLLESLREEVLVLPEEMELASNRFEAGPIIGRLMALLAEAGASE